MGEVKDAKSVSITDVFEIVACVVVTSNYNQLSCFMNKSTSSTRSIQINEDLVKFEINILKNNVKKNRSHRC